jgi:hypothetical protein
VIIRERQCTERGKEGEKKEKEKEIERPSVSIRERQCNEKTFDIAKALGH